jgi:TolA-binding protein
VEQIAKESAGTHELMGKLDDMAGTMEDVAKDLEKAKLDDEVLERQEKILTRMLDSQRSMRRRDYKRERMSETAGDVKALAPQNFEGETDETQAILRMIQRAMQEKGPAEYEELIRQYFRALSRKVREGQ